MANESIMRDQPISLSRGQVTALFIAVPLVSLIILLQLRDYVIHIAALMAGIPIAILLLNGRLRQVSLVLLFALVPFVGILKAITGSRFAPLTFDLAIAAGCFLGLLILGYRKRLRIGVVDLVLLAFLMLAVAAMTHPNVPGLVAGLEGFRKFAFAAVAFFVGRHLLLPRHLWLLQKVTIFSSLLIALYGIKQFFFMSELDWRIIELATSSAGTYTMGGQVRPFATLPGPFHLGLYLLISGLLVLSQLFVLPQPLHRRLWLYGILAAQIVALFLTRTKANWFGFVIGAAVLTVLAYGIRLKVLLRLGGLTILGACVILLILATSSGTGNETLRDAIDAFTNPAEAPTFVFRMQLWTDEMLPAILESPIFGYGTSSAGEGLSFYYSDTTGRWFSSHSLYLKVLLELGIAGFILFCMVVALSMRLGWRKFRILRRNRSTFMQHYLWAGSVICAFLIAGIAVPTLDAYPANYFFWLLLGSITAPLSRLTDDN